MTRNTAYSGNNKNHSFNQVPRAELPRSTFDFSSNLKTTLDAGLLYPIYIDPDILPGDTVHMDTALFSRMATPIYPLMDQLYVDTFWFFVPNRLVWDKWQFFMGEEEVPGDAQLPPKYTVPQVTFNTVNSQSFADLCGLPLTSSPITVNAMPFRAMNLIWNEWLRDESIQTRRVVPKDGGVVSPPSTPDSSANYTFLTRGKRKDYFSGALPWPQKGPTVLLPLGATAPVTGTITASGAPTWSGGGGTNTPITHSGGTLASGNLSHGADAGTGNLTWGTSPGLTLTGAVANLATATSATINELRQSFQVQRLLERDARSGSRYVETLKAHFGVTSPDSRLQRPEYLAGGTINVQMNPVPQTSESTANAVQGGLAAYATASGSGGSFTHSFTEHGMLFCFASFRAPLNYQQGLHKSWRRKTRFDYYWPVLQNLGEQAIKNEEIMYQGTAADANTFGYQERWAEYRYRPSIITGLFRSNSPTPLDAWHLAQDFATLPTLNSTYIVDSPPVDRVVAVQNEPQFLVDVYFRCKMSRVMPVYSVPGLIDHF